MGDLKEALAAGVPMAVNIVDQVGEGGWVRKSVQIIIRKGCAEMS